MKTFALILSLSLLALPAAAGDHPLASEDGWFDLENCAFCKNLLTDPGLLPHMTWETHKIDDGMMYITTVDAHFRDAFDAAHKNMEKLGSDMMTGAVDPTQVEMCGSCAAFGQLMMAGVTMEQVPGAAAEVSLITSDDPDVVARLHEYADHNNKAMAEIMASSHEHGHDHAHQH